MKPLLIVITLFICFYTSYIASQYPPNTYCFTPQASYTSESYFYYTNSSKPQTLLFVTQTEAFYDFVSSMKIYLFKSIYFFIIIIINLLIFRCFITKFHYINVNWKCLYWILQILQPNLHIETWLSQFNRMEIIKKKRYSKRY